MSTETKTHSDSLNIRKRVDIVIVGGGIIGLATAYRLLERFPEKRITVLEKEPTIASHQTGHNSGVLHSGIYYKPGSLKAINCREGKVAMEQFCAENDVRYEICGKVIVATNQSEIPALEEIFVRGKQNGVQCEIVDRDRLAELEPHVAGVQAIHVPEAGIVDYGQVCEKLAERIRDKGAQIITAAKVLDIRRWDGAYTAETTVGDVTSTQLVNCAGLHCDRVAKMTLHDSPAKIVPFRGEYYELKPEAFHLCKNLVYPVPNPEFPFLGVHFTRMIDGTVECGPNAVLAFSREGYKKFDVDLGDLFESLSYPGFLRLASRYWKVGAGEVWRSISKRAFVKALQGLIPEIQGHLIESAPAGVRAQAVTPDGKMVDDFLLVNATNLVNVCNAPSPAATSSLNIGKKICEQLAKNMA